MFEASHGICHMPWFNMKSLGFISKYTQWTLLYCFLVNLCVAIEADITCSGPLGYDVTPLTTGTWTYAGVNQSCLAGPNINATCKITLSFCNKIPTICNGLSSACVQASNFTGKNDTAVFSIGQYTQDPFSRSEKGDKIVATFDSVAHETSNITYNLTTVVEFTCNLQAVWTPNAAGATIPKIANLMANLSCENNTRECQYKITADYNGACINLVPPTAVDNRLSAGTVLIIIFFVSISIYCMFGCACNFTRGYKGQELIPHSAFWIDLPVLIADGMIFTFSCCRQESSAYDSI